MPTANEDLFDNTIRHQIYVRRYVDNEVRRMLLILSKSDPELAENLRKVLSGKRTQKQLRKLMLDLKTNRKEIWDEFRKELRSDLVELAKIEATAELAVLAESLPISIELQKVNMSFARSVATSSPFEGKLLKDWFSELETRDGARINQIITRGAIEGRTTDDIVREIVGTKANDYKDGALAISRRNATAVVRTATNHVANKAREEVWDKNADIISAIRWASTLDGRTSPVCQARDGMFATVGGKPLPKGYPPLEPDGARPPAHMQCRSIMIPVFDDIGVLGNRPFVRDKRTRAKREVDFRKQAKEKAGKKWSDLSTKEKNGRIRDERTAWGKENIGRVPAETTYAEWMKKQPASFQDEVLGKTRGQLFRKGEVSLDKFVDRAGNQLTLDELRDKIPQSFKKAGL